MMIPTMTPNSPNADAKISTTSIFTNKLLFSASANAQLLPTMPTQILHQQRAPVNNVLTATSVQQVQLGTMSCRAVQAE